MLRCIKQLQCDPQLYNNVMEHLKAQGVDRFPFEESNQNRAMLYRLLRGDTLNRVSEEFGVSLETCSSIVTALCKNYTIVFRDCPDSILRLRLTTRAYFCLSRSGLRTMRDLVNYYKTYGSFTNIRNCGEYTNKCIVQEMKIKGLI